MSGTSNSPLGIPASELRRQRQVRLRKAMQLRWRHRFRRLVRAVLAACAIFIAALVFASVSGGLGSGGIILTFFAMAAAFILFALFPRTRSMALANSGPCDLPTLADRTQTWLETQRPLLPAKVQAVVDLLGSRLEELSPQLGALSENDPADSELRKLLGDHLPSLIGSFTSIPSALTHQPHAGSTPAEQLHAGLETVAREVESIGKAIANNELDALAIRERYLGTRYDAARSDDGDHLTPG